MDDERFVSLQRQTFARIANAEPAHDELHVRRVMASARAIAIGEQADVEIAVTAALLHELFNLPKSHPDSSRSGEICADHARQLMRDNGYDEPMLERVAYCIAVHSFSRGIHPETIEARVLQDADRLDAIGAIGIARLFATCAEMKRPFYDPRDPFCRERPADDKQFGVDHFYKKLLKIPDGLHTETARLMARERMTMMRAYLDQLARELG
jgi:uncharacterized protein